MLIAISGIDCAGKSTQIELLRRHFERRGRAVETLWHRPGYSPALDAARALIRRLRPAALPTAERPAERARAFARPGVAEAWVAAALADTLVCYAVRVRTLLARGRVVLCDRYLEDAALDFELRFPHLAAAARRGLRAVRVLSPVPDAAFLLTLERAEMARRMAAKDEPFPDPPAVREARYRAYREIAAAGKLIPIDATPPADVVHRRILERLEERGAGGP